MRVEPDQPRSMVGVGRRVALVVAVLLVSFLLLSSLALARVAPGPAVRADAFDSTSPLISFEFTAGDEGWLLGDPSLGAPVYSASDGHPGGYIADSGGGVGLQSAALSPQGAAFGGTLGVDYRFRGTAFNQLGVELVSNSGAGMSGFANAEQDPEIWLHDSFALGEGNGNAWFSTESGRYMDDAEIRAILNDLSLIKVYPGGLTTLNVDNVTLNPPQHEGARLSIAERNGTFKGKLSKASPECGYRRSFGIFQKRAGPDARVGRIRTITKPTYEIHTKADHGKFYAQALELDLPDQGVICDASKSKTIVIKDH